MQKLIKLQVILLIFTIYGIQSIDCEHTVVLRNCQRTKSFCYVMLILRSYNRNINHIILQCSLRGFRIITMGN